MALGSAPSLLLLAIRGELDLGGGHACTGIRSRLHTEPLGEAVAQIVLGGSALSLLQEGLERGSTPKGSARKADGSPAWLLTKRRPGHPLVCRDASVKLLEEPIPGLLLHLDLLYEAFASGHLSGQLGLRALVLAAERLDLSL